MRLSLPAGLAAAAFVLAPRVAPAQEVFAGVYAHAVETPFTFETGESGADIVAGVRFAPVDALSFIGSPEPYVVGSLNTAGDTSFAGAGLSWILGLDRRDAPRFYARPGLGIIVHDGPGKRVGSEGQRTELGSRVLFEPEISLGMRFGPRLSVEASWMHVSHARIFDSGQNPGIDMWGVRLNWKL